MEKPIKYKRISGIYNSESLQKLFDQFIIDNDEIINYREEILSGDEICVSIVTKRMQDNLSTIKQIL